MKIYENLRKFMKIYENLRKSMKIYENLLKMGKILQNVGIYGGFVVAKIENAGFSLVLPLLLFFEGSRAVGASQEHQKLSEKYRQGGGKGRVNPPPRRLVWRFWEVWRVCY